MLNPVREGEEDYIEAIRYRRRLKIFENFLFFFVLSVSCWNIRFGAISNLRPTNSAKFETVFTYFTSFESARPYSLYFWSISSISDSLEISASLCSARKLIKYSKPNAVRACRNAFIRDFPDFVDIYPDASLQLFFQTFHSFRYLSDHIWSWQFLERIFRL